MNTHRFPSCRLLCFLTVLLLVGAGCHTVQENNVPLDSKVVRLKGSARSSRDGQTWSPIRVGDVLPPGCIVETSTDEKTFVDLVPGQGIRPPSLVEPDPERNVVRLLGSSTLRLTKVATKNNCGRPLEVRLDLRAGKMLGYVSSRLPGLQYALELTNAIAHPKGKTVYVITARGETTVLTGAVTLALKDRTQVKAVVAPHTFDPSTGLTTKINPYEYGLVPHVPITLPTAPPEWPSWPKRRF